MYRDELVVKTLGVVPGIIVAIIKEEVGLIFIDQQADFVSIAPEA